MIKVDKGSVEMQGAVTMLLSEFTCLCGAMKELMVKDGKSEAEAKKHLEECIEMAFMSKAEIDEEVKKALLAIIMKGLGV